MDLSHRQAFELLQRSVDGPLGAEERADLERHLAVCTECQTYAALHRRLEEVASEFHSTAMPPKHEIERTILETEKHFRRWRMLNRLFISPVRVAIWAGVAVAFALAVIFLFDIAPQRNQTGSVAVTRIVNEPMAELIEVTRVVKETVFQKVEVTPVFDAEAEKEIVAAVSIGIDDNHAIADREAVLAVFHEDLTGYYSNPDDWGSWTYQDLGPDWLTDPYRLWWDDYEVLVSPELAVVKGNRNNQDGIRTLHTSVFKKEDGQWKLIHTHGSYAGP